MPITVHSRYIVRYIRINCTVSGGSPLNLQPSDSLPSRVIYFASVANMRDPVRGSAPEKRVFIQSYEHIAVVDQSPEVLKHKRSFFSNVKRY